MAKFIALTARINGAPITINTDLISSVVSEGAHDGAGSIVFPNYKSDGFHVNESYELINRFLGTICVEDSGF